MDFSIKIYANLLISLQSQGFSFLSYSQFARDEKSIIKPFIILRHDVEASYENALRMAEIEYNLGIQGSFYFRIYPLKKNEEIIQKIVVTGHEIGYHYDDLSVCRGNYEAAIERFQKNLAYLQQFAPVTTITMEGAPLSKYDNRKLWDQTLKPSTNQQINKSTALQAHYSQFGIIAEPYFDMNFNEVFYLTDTGRRWDGHRFNVRDKATIENPVTNPEFLKLRFHSTQDIIDAVKARNAELKANGQEPKAIFPDRAMLNFHPQRWNDKPVPWLKELILQNIKNQGKRLLVKLHS